MPDLMHRRFPFVVTLDRKRAARHAPRQDVAAVGGVVGGGVFVRVAVEGVGVGYQGGEGAVAQEGGGGAVGVRGGREVGLEVEVQVGVGAAAEGLFHQGAVGVGGPVVADGVGGRVEVEADVGGFVGCVEDGYLFVGMCQSVFNGSLVGIFREQCG